MNISKFLKYFTLCGIGACSNDIDSVKMEEEKDKAPKKDEIPKSDKINVTEKFWKNYGTSKLGQIKVRKTPLNEPLRGSKP